MVAKALKAIVVLPIAVVLFALAVLTAPIWVSIQSYRRDGLKIALVTGGGAFFVYGFIGFLIFGR
jgi:hypothetical protein